MKKILGAVILIACVIPMATYAQGQFKVPQVEIRDVDNNPTNIPMLGKKNLLIFYPDPDHALQNQKFTDDLEQREINSDNIYSFGVVNLKDAPLLPNAVVRAVTRSKVNKTGAKIYTDPCHKLRDAWRLGDVNDKFVVLFITKDCEIAFMHKGEMSQADIDRFFKTIEKYR